jgi:hypothetical protein
MTMQATIKKVEPIYSELREIIRTVVEIEEDTDPLLVVGHEAEQMANLCAGTHIQYDFSIGVTMTDNRHATLVEHTSVL